MTSSIAVLRQEPQYLRLTAAGFISGIGDWFNNVALFALVLRLTGSGMTVALLLVVRMIPNLLMGPAAGMLADKYNRKWILVLSDLARMVFALSFILVHSSHQLWISYVGTFGLVAFSALFGPARMAVVPQLVRDEHLSAANALQESTSGFVMAIGSLLGGVITAGFGVHSAFILNSMTFLASALLCMSIQLPSAQPSSLAGENLRSGPRIRLLDVLRKNSIIQTLFMMEAIWPIGGGMINVLLSVYAFRVFRMGKFGIGLLYGALGIGFIVGGILTTWFAKYGRLAVLTGLGLEAICQIGASQAPNIWFAAGLLVVATVGAGVSNACLNTFVMKGVDGQVLGRVYSLFATMSSTIMSLSMLVAGILLSQVAPRTLGTYGGAFMLISALCSGWMLRRAESRQ